MRNKYLYLLFVVIFLIGCSNEISQPNQESFSQTNLATCATAECPEISIDYILYPDKKDREASVNNSITDFIIASLYLEDPKQESRASTINEAATGFIESYWQDHAEFPDLAAAYFVEISVTESYRSESLLSLEMSQYKYTGGAHGYGTLNYANFDAKTGAEITSKNLFTDFDSFTGFAEQHFRKAFNISEDSSINADRFWFDNDTFYVPESIGFMKDSLVLHYNQYEVASYADGPIEVYISLKEAGPFLNF